MDLLLEDICKMDWAASLVKSGREIVKFINNHQSSLAIFREHSKLDLAMPGGRHYEILSLSQMCV